MSGALVSEVCGVAMQLDVSSTRVEVYYSKAVNYTLKTTIVTFIQVYPPPPPSPGSLMSPIHF